MAARFVAASAGAAPFIIQVETARADSMLRVYRFELSGDNSSGSITRPALYRPATAGTGLGNVARPLAVQSGAATCPAYNSFSANPTIPSLATLSAKLPKTVEWVASPGGELLVVGNGSTTGKVVLYAGASGGHTWSGEINWEEQ